jgi:16S rRNA processing protein RimM
MCPAGREPDTAARPTDHDERLVVLGRVVNRHGIRGEVRLLPHNPQSSTLLNLPVLLLLHPDGRHERRRVLGARPHKHFVLLQLEGVTTANDADALRGCDVALPRADLPPAGAAAVYHVDLIGCAVRTTAGEPLGTVDEVMSTASTDICVVRGAGREHLIPLVADVIAALDPVARSIVVHPLPGLLDD